MLAGAVLGATASLLWAAQGAVMMAYPREQDKGRSFALFWGIFQMGTIVGAAIALGIQAHSTLPGVSTGVYLAFLVIMLTAVLTSWLLLPPEAVVRADGTCVGPLARALSPRAELAALRRLACDKRMLALFPMFFASNFFYSYQGALTAALFNGRTRALVALLEGAGQVAGSLALGQLTDNLPFGRRRRALVSAALVAALNCAVWGGGLAFQLQFARGDAVVRGQPIPWDWTAAGGVATGPILLLTAYYLADATYQGLAYYTMSALTNDPFELARMAGYYKGVQSAGAAVSFGMDAVKVGNSRHQKIYIYIFFPACKISKLTLFCVSSQQTGYLQELIISWALLFVSLPLCFWVLLGVRDTNYDVEPPVVVVPKVGGGDGGAIDGVEPPVPSPPGHDDGAGGQEDVRRRADNKAAVQVHEEQQGSTSASG